MARHQHFVICCCVLAHYHEEYYAINTVLHAFKLTTLLCNSRVTQCSGRMFLKKQHYKIKATF